MNYCCKFTRLVMVTFHPPPSSPPDIPPTTAHFHVPCMNTRTKTGVPMFDESVICDNHLNWFGDILPSSSFFPSPPLSLYPPGLGGAWKVLKLRALWWAVKTTSTPHGSRVVLPCPCNSPPTTLLVHLPTMPQPTSTPLPLQRPLNTEHDPPQAPCNQKFQVQYQLLM